MRQFVRSLFPLSGAALVLAGLVSFSCGQKRENDSAELAAVAYLIAIGVLRPSAIVRPSAEGDPGNAQAMETTDELLPCVDCGPVSSPP